MAIGALLSFSVIRTCRRTLLSRALIDTEYHRAWMLSLLCSKWEEVDHIQVEHRQIRNAENKHMR